jgi:hypothetical protein
MTNVLCSGSDLAEKFRKNRIAHNGTTALWDLPANRNAMIRLGKFVVCRKCVMGRNYNSLYTKVDH